MYPNQTYLKKFVLPVTVLLLGERNGKKFGKRLSIVVMVVNKKEAVRKVPTLRYS
jgi:hypothetical protein